MSDEFEAKYMSDGAKIVHRDKHVSRKMAAILAAPSILMLILAVVVPLVNSSSDKPLPTAAVPLFAIGMVALAALYVVLAISMAVLRFVVTERAIHVKYGLWGPTIPLESVVSCKVVDYDWTTYGGWGIRRGRDGSRAYVARSGSVVEVRYSEDGQEKKVVLGAEDARALAESIDRARERVRVAVDEPRAESEADEEEAEALSDSSPVRSRRRLGR